MRNREGPRPVQPEKPERLSVGVTDIHAEGSRSTAFVMILTLVALGLAFFMGLWSVLVNACFGFRL